MVEPRPLTTSSPSHLIFRFTHIFSSLVHRLKCECCPGHSLTVSHYPSMSVSGKVNCVTRSHICSQYLYLCHLCFINLIRNLIREPQRIDPSVGWRNKSDLYFFHLESSSKISENSPKKLWPKKCWSHPQTTWIYIFCRTPNKHFICPKQDHIWHSWWFTHSLFVGKELLGQLKKWNIRWSNVENCQGNALLPILICAELIKSADKIISF